MTIRKTLMGLLGGLAMATITATGAFAQQVTLKMHHFLPPQANVPKQVLEVWARDVERDSGGSLKIDIFPSMQLGGTPPQLLDRAINGTDDIVWTVIGYTPGRYPSTEVFELPFMMKDARSLSCAFWKMFDKDIRDREFSNVHIIGTWVHGPGLFHTKDPVQKVTDLRGMKIRGGSRTVVQLLDTVGATSVPMPVPKVAEGLSKGVIDGTTIPWEVTSALKVSELVENHTEFDGEALYTLTFVLAMNKAKYESLSATQKAAIDKNSGLEFSVFAGGVMSDSDGPARQIAVDNGNNIINISGRDLAEWKDAVSGIYDKWIADVKGKGLDGAAMIAEARQNQDTCARELGR